MIVADSHPVTAGALSWLLREHGYSVATVADRDELFANITKSAPDVILLDGDVGRRDRDLLHQVRAGEQWRDVRVIVTAQWQAGLIACFLRDLGPAEAAATLDALAEHAGDLLGVGLDSAEVGYPPGDFARVFSDARGLGLHTVAHAGEEGPPEYVWEALDVLGVERVDHGIRSVEDPALLRRLAADQTPLTVCPLSNVRLRCVEAIASHPIGVLLEAGVNVTVNSDDPAYFGGYVADNYLALAAELRLGYETLAVLAANSLAACLDHPSAR